MFTRYVALIKTHRIVIALAVTMLMSLGLYKGYTYYQPLQNVKNFPNIILIIADDIAWNDYGFNGHPIIKTPHIDQLAQDGVLFNNGYTPNSICRPSLASIITGLYPYQHRIQANGRKLNQRNNIYNFGRTPYSVQMNKLHTLPRALSQLGYNSLQTGKWWEEGFTNGGFDEGDKIPEGFFRQVTRKNAIGRTGLDPIYEFIEKNKGQPFFIWYAPQMPHTPYAPPERWLNQYRNKTENLKQAKYWAMVSWFDETVGDLRLYLKNKKISDNTLIIYLADNGVQIDNDSATPDVKDSPFEQGIRTPIVFHWPNANWTPETADAFASTMDIFPTIMDILHHPLEKSSGISLLPILSKSKAPKRTFVAGEGYFDTGENLNSELAFRWIRFDQWKLIAHKGINIELYNLIQDPHELNNLANQPESLPVQMHLLTLLNSELPVGANQNH